MDLVARRTDFAGSGQTAYTAGVSTQKENAAAPGQWSEYYKPDYSLPEIHDHLRQMTPFVDKCREHFGGSRILEIGTGSGILALYFSQLGYQVTGLDLDTAIVETNDRLNRTYGGSARFVGGDMLHLPFSAGAFDACYHQGLMEHFDPPEIVRALKAQTKTCRKVVFAVPTIRWNGGVFGDERMWTGSFWLRLLDEFRVLDVFGMSYSGLFSRALNLTGQRLTANRPALLYRAMAKRRAGQIGFVIAGR